MGFAVARAAREAGAEVAIVCGPTSLAPPRGCTLVRVESAEQMFAAVKSRLDGCDVFIGVAAVADYRPARAAEHKIKKSDRSMTVELVPTTDILAHVAGLPNAPFCVGFAAESRNLEEYAQDKRSRKRIPLLAANLVQEAIGADDNELVLFDDSGRHVLARAPKLEQARQLIARAAELMQSAARAKRP
jgi:phosphopantothenoylcysteine decarboxylase/phosphopantothenate--cysteine ligase